MKVLLKRTIAGVGLAGQIIDVADAYARNYLLPRKLAVPATANVQAQQAAQTSRLQNEHIRQQATLDALVKRLEGVNLRFTAPASPQGKLFASIKASDLAQELHRQYQLDTRHIRCEPDHLKTLGEHQVQVSIADRHFTCLVTIAHAKT